MSIFRKWLIRLLVGKYVVAVNLRDIDNLITDTSENDRFMLLNFGSRRKDGTPVLFFSVIKTEDFKSTK